MGTKTLVVTGASSGIGRTVAHEAARRGRSGKALAALHALAPAVVDRVFAKKMPENQFRPGPAAPSAGNLFESGPEWATETGNWR